MPLWRRIAGVPFRPWSNKSTGNLQSCFMLQKLPSLTNLISVDKDERVNFTAEESRCDFPFCGAAKRGGWRLGVGRAVLLPCLLSMSWSCRERRAGKTAHCGRRRGGRRVAEKEGDL